MQKDSGKLKNILLIVIILLLLAVIGILLFKGNPFSNGGNVVVTPTGQSNTPIGMEENQGEYEIPEMANFVSKNITLPGWGGFNIPANTKNVTQGFEFHNPESNIWSEVDISYNGKVLENLIVEPDRRGYAEHYAKLAGINGSNYSFKSFDSNCFSIGNDEGGDYISAIKSFEDEKKIIIEVDGKEYEFSAKCRENLYYMTFALYLTQGDELLYQSGLVAPGKYVQRMEMSRGLPAGDYDAYVLIQPYRADKQTPTNNGKVVISLSAK